MKPIEQFLHESDLPKRQPESDEVIYLKRKVGYLRIALAEIATEAEAHDETNPRSGITRRPLGYQRIYDIAREYISTP